MAGHKIAKLKPTAEQIGAVFRLALTGASEGAINAAIAKQWPEADARPIIVAVVQEFQRAGNFDGDAATAMLGFCYEATRELYRKLLAEENYLGALKAIKQMSDIAEKRL
jgi:hypothetical protein